MSRSGRFVMLRADWGVHIVDAIGTAPRVAIELTDVDDFVWVGEAAWIAAGGLLRRYAAGGAVRGVPIEIGRGGELVAAPGTGARTAAWLGAPALLIVENLDQLEVIPIAGLSAPLEAGSFVVPLGGRRALVARQHQLALVDIGRDELVTHGAPFSIRASAAAQILGGRAFACLVDGTAEESTIVLCDVHGRVIRRVTIPPPTMWAIADQRALAVLVTATELISLDLRFGVFLARHERPSQLLSVDVDDGGKYVVLCTADPGAAPAVVHTPLAALFATTSPSSVDDAPAELDEPGPIPLAIDALVDAAPVVTPSPAPAPIAAPPVLTIAPLQGLCPVHDSGQPQVAIGPPGAVPFASVGDHIQALLGVIVARTVRAIAASWHTGLLSIPEGPLPFLREVEAIAGNTYDAAATQIDRADARLRSVLQDVARRTQASLAAGMRLPFAEVAREFELSPLAAECLLVVAGPLVRGELARLYGILANDPTRPICDRHLVEKILGGDKVAVREAVAAQLEDGAPLVRYGLIQVRPVPHDRYLFASLSVDPVLAARLRGSGGVARTPGAISVAYETERRLETLFIPPATLAEIVDLVSQPRPVDAPLRLVLHGRRGSGRRTLCAALAQHAGRSLVVINAERLAQSDGNGLVAQLRVELQRASLRGAVPCVSGLTSFDDEEKGQLREHVRELFRTYPGPVLFRADVELTLPLDPGYSTAVLPTATETERRIIWTHELAAHGLRADHIDDLAQRFRITAGAIISAIGTVRSAVDPELPADDVTGRLDAAARQHIAARLNTVASRVSRLANWEEVCLPEEVLDSISEFIGRAAHRKTVFESWGFDPATARGMTALFAGPPGTGKTLVAGLVARELGLELYRIDLARIVSKWIGETEKNLAEVFDAAEDGQCVIVFDEADSLFARRTEVKSSVDRYANLEVNYLLQRLDTFEGIAILTTNIEGSIDDAFKRRMSMRLTFPFPDEETRLRLWAAHIPAQAPVQGDLKLLDIATRFPLSGGYIRNCALRAAFLAAQKGSPLTHEHLLRAINLEYLDIGKLQPGGRLT